MRDRHSLRMILIIVLVVLYHAEYGSATKNTVKLAVSTSASTRKEPVSLGLVGGFIAVSVVLLIGVILLIIIVCRMKRKIRNLKAIKCSTHGGDAVQDIEKKTEDNLHYKNESVNEYRDFHEKNPHKKDTNHKQPPKLPERRNRTDVIISPNSLVESMEAKAQDIIEKYKVQEGDDNNTGDYPNIAAFPEMEERKMPINDLKGSSAKIVKFDNLVTVYSNEAEDIKDQEVCNEKEMEFTEKMDKIVTVDVNLPSYDDADVSESELYEEYDYSSGENKGTTTNTTILKKPFNSKGNNIPPNDDDMIEEFVYEESQTCEIDPKNTNQRDVLSKNAKPLQYYEEAIYEEPVSSNFRDSGLPKYLAPDIPNLPMLSMTLQNKSEEKLKEDGGKIHTMKEGLSNENIVTKSISENGESNQKAQRSVSDINASRASPEPPNVPKRKRKVAPKSSVSPSEGTAQINMNGDM